MKAVKLILCGLLIGPISYADSIKKEVKRKTSDNNVFAKIYTKEKEVKFSKETRRFIQKLSISTFEKSSEKILFRFQSNEEKKSPIVYKDKKEHLLALRKEAALLKANLYHESNILESNLPYGNYIDDRASAALYNTISQTYSDGYLKSAFFAGVGIGGANVFTSGFINGNTTNNLLSIRISPFLINGRGGYQRFFNHYIGTRIYGGLLISPFIFSKVSQFDLGNNANYVESNNLFALYALGYMSVDVMFEVPIDKKLKHFIGGYGGINIGIMYYRTYDKNNYPVPLIWDYNLQVDYSLNLGMSLSLSNLHRVELGLAIPLSYLALPGFASEASNVIGADFWRSAIFMVNYSMLINFKKRARISK